MSLVANSRTRAFCPNHCTCSLTKVNQIPVDRTTWLFLLAWVWNDLLHIWSFTAIGKTSWYGHSIIFHYIKNIPIGKEHSDHYWVINGQECHHSKGDSGLTDFWLFTQDESWLLQFWSSPDMWGFLTRLTWSWTVAQIVVMAVYFSTRKKEQTLAMISFFDQWPCMPPCSVACKKKKQD